MSGPVPPEGVPSAVPDPLLHQGVHLPEARTFDLALFRELQEEYRHRPIVPVARGLDSASLAEAAERRVGGLTRKLGDITGARVLEIGCGRGHVSRVLADRFGCETVGVDVVASDSWAERPDLDFHQHDISSMDNAFLGKFDLIVSFAVWEHVEHPFAALSAARSMLEETGRKVMFANLYRGPKASHRYREIFFPWPHLLFEDDVVVDYYRRDLGMESSGSAWVNKLTVAHYLTYFDRAGLHPEQLWYSPIDFDEEFYARFEDVLGRYPVFDLKRDFLNVVLTPGEVVDPEVDATELRQVRGRLARLERQRDRAQRRVRELEGSRSWRLTEPLRRARGRTARPGP